MTAVAELCGRWWRSTGRCTWSTGRCTWSMGRYRVAHRCFEPADHPTPCRCRCGATTTEGATR